MPTLAPPPAAAYVQTKDLRPVAQGSDGLLLQEILEAAVKHFAKSVMGRDSLQSEQSTGLPHVQMKPAGRIRVNFLPPTILRPSNITRFGFDE